MYNVAIAANGALVAAATSDNEIELFDSKGMIVGVLDASPVEYATTEILYISPNPSFGQTTARFTLPQPGRVTLGVFDALGRMVLRRVESLGQGEHSLPLRLAYLPPGRYYVMLQAGEHRRSAPLVISR